MTDHSHAIKSSRGNEYERDESFTSSAPVSAKIDTKSGDIAVSVGEGSDITVILRASTSRYEYLLEGAEVTFNADSNELDIRTLPKNSLGRSKEGKKKRTWFDFGGYDLDVFVVLPEGSSLDIKSVSGDVALEGTFDEIKLLTISGDVEAYGNYDHLDVHSASGDVSVGHVAGFLKCVTASGDIACLGAGAITEVHSASGDVNVAVTQPGTVTAKVVSGDILVSVVRGLAVDIDGTTVSGDLGTNIDLDGEGEGSSDDDTVSIKASTVSGDIRIDTLRSRGEPRGPWEHSSSEEHKHVVHKGNTELRFGRIASTPDE
jgi:DUF4097 and DUF4098 domain-containing protein YvlB